MQRRRVAPHVAHVLKRARALHARVPQVEAENGFGGKEEMEALMYVCPTQHAGVLDTSRPWNYTEFRTGHLKAFVEEVVKPHRARYDELEVANANAPAAAH
jgi:hypothetical protein